VSLTARRARRAVVAASAASLLAAAALLRIGLAVPDLLINEGLDHAGARQQGVAREALELADHACLDNRLQRLTVRAIRVVDVSSARTSNRSSGGSPLGRHTVQLQTYTLFAVPTQKMTVKDGEVDCGVG
jgi:hypothetical protein